MYYLYIYTCIISESSFSYLGNDVTYAQATVIRNSSRTTRYVIQYAEKGKEDGRRVTQQS